MSSPPQTSKGFMVAVLPQYPINNDNSLRINSQLRFLLNYPRSIPSLSILMSQKHRSTSIPSFQSRRNLSTFGILDTSFDSPVFESRKIPPEILRLTSSEGSSAPGGR